MESNAMQILHSFTDDSFVRQIDTGTNTIETKHYFTREDAGYGSDLCQNLLASHNVRSKDELYLNGTRVSSLNGTKMKHYTSELTYTFSGTKSTHPNATNYIYQGIAPDTATTLFDMNLSYSSSTADVHQLTKSACPYSYETRDSKESHSKGRYEEVYFETANPSSIFTLIGSAIIRYGGGTGTSTLHMEYTDPVFLRPFVAEKFAIYYTVGNL